VEASANSPNLDKHGDLRHRKMDASSSNDHVDTHRSFCQVISPWIKNRDSGFSFLRPNSVLKSIELLLGLSPMSQYDHLANPIIGRLGHRSKQQDCIRCHPAAKDISSARMNPSISSYGFNDPRSRLAKLSAKMNWSIADAVPTSPLMPILVEGCKGHKFKGAGAACQYD